MQSSRELLEALSNAVGVSGFEDEVRELIRDRVTPLVDDVWTDALGNLFAVRHGAANEGSDEGELPTLMLAAHMDEVGLVVSHVEESGLIRFACVGGLDERVLPAQVVVLRTRAGKRIHGVIGTTPPHIQREEERRKPYSMEAMFIDVGARSREEVAELGLRVGDCAVADHPFRSLAGDGVLGRAFDDRAGCTVLIRVLQELSLQPPLPVRVAAAFTTFEEIGARGAHVAAYTLNPDVALVLEGTVAADVTGVSAHRCPSKQGAGPVITLMDRHTHCSPAVTSMLEQLAEAGGIPWQNKTPIFGGSDAARIHISRHGVPTGVVSVPCRYIHSSAATLRLRDLEETVKLVKAFAEVSAELVHKP